MTRCCPLTGNDDGPNQAEFVDIIAARKERLCCECRDPITPGARYERYKILDDGRWGTYATCLSCVEIRDHFACDGWIFEHLWEDLEENFFPDMRAGGPCMEGLSPEAKGRLFERRMKWLER